MDIYPYYRDGTAPPPLILFPDGCPPIVEQILRIWRGCRGSWFRSPPSFVTPYIKRTRSPLFFTSVDLLLFSGGWLIRTGDFFLFFKFVTFYKRIFLFERFFFHVKIALYYFFAVIERTDVVVLCCFGRHCVEAASTWMGEVHCGIYTSPPCVWPSALFFGGVKGTVKRLHISPPHHPPPSIRFLDFILVSFCVFVIMNGKVLTWYFFLILDLNGEHEDIITWQKKKSGTKSRNVSNGPEKIILFIPPYKICDELKYHHCVFII